MRHGKVERAVSLQEQSNWPQAIREHMQTCARCRAFAQENSRVRELLRARQGYTGDEAAALRIRNGIAARLETAPRRRFMPAWQPLPAWTLLRAAALVCVAAAGLFFLARSGPFDDRQHGAQPEIALPAPTPPAPDPAAPRLALPATPARIPFSRETTTHQWHQVEQPRNPHLRPQPRLVDFQP